MNAVAKWIADAIIIVIGASLIVALFFAAVLQESYRLCPVTPEEMEVVR